MAHNGVQSALAGIQPAHFALVVGVWVGKKISLSSAVAAHLHRTSLIACDEARYEPCSPQRPSAQLETLWGPELLDGH